MVSDVPSTDPAAAATRVQPVAEAVFRASAPEQATTAPENAPRTESDNEEFAADVTSAKGELALPQERRIEFAFDDAIKRLIVTVRSAEDDEIVRQIPPEHEQRFLARFNELIGVLFDETA